MEHQCVENCDHEHEHEAAMPALPVGGGFRGLGVEAQAQQEREEG